MDADEREICEFLKSFPGQYISGKEIARRSGGKWKFQENPNWALPVLLRLKEQKLVENNASGQYRLTADVKKEKKKKWISPHIQKILEESGKDFSEATSEQEGQAAAETPKPPEAPGNPAPGGTTPSSSS